MVARARKILTVLACIALLGCMPPPRCQVGEQIEVIHTDGGPFYYCRRSP